MNSYRSFFRTFSFWLVFFAFSGMLFNFIVNPFDVWVSFEKRGFNKIKIKFADYEGVAKPIKAIQNRPKIVFFGSSRARLGLDPGHESLDQSKGVYNFAMGSANINEIDKYFSHALKNQPDLDVVVLGLDFFMFNLFDKDRPDSNEKIVGATSIVLDTGLKLLFSLNSFRASMDTIRYNLQNPDDLPPTLSNGMTNYSRLRGLELQRGIDRKAEFETTISSYFANNNPENMFYGKFALSDLAFENLNNIATTAKNHGVSLKVFFSPAHAMELEIIDRMDLWDDFEDYKRRVVTICGEVWDFADYSSVTTEIIDNSMLNYTDHSHYTPKIGGMVLHRLIGGDADEVPEDFGVLLNLENLDEHLKSIKNRQKSWREANSQVREWFEGLYQKQQARNIVF